MSTDVFDGQHGFRCARLGLNTLGLGQHLHDNATVGADLPLVARRAELAVLTGAIEAARSARGEAALLTGEAGVGKTRLLVEAQREAERRGLLVLKGRAVESGGGLSPTGRGIRSGLGAICRSKGACKRTADPGTDASWLGQ
jgi:predicted ATPase